MAAQDEQLVNRRLQRRRGLGACSGGRQGLESTGAAGAPKVRGINVGCCAQRFAVSRCQTERGRPNLRGVSHTKESEVVMRVAVTGGSGFIGGFVVAALHSAGITVRCLLRPTSSTKRIDHIPFERVQGDVTDAASVKV